MDDKSPPVKLGQRDPEGRRAALLDAALVEFAEHGLEGARTSAIASRAGVNKQLISHHFGGKEGLYRALIDRWLEEEAAYGGAGTSLADLAASYARSAVDDRALHKLLLRGSLDGEANGAGIADADLEDIRRRQREGEIAGELDAGFVLLALQSIAAAGLVFPDDARRVTGMDPASAEFAAWQQAQLRLLVARLA